MALPENYIDCPTCYSGIIKKDGKHKCCKRCREDNFYFEMRGLQQERQAKMEEDIRKMDRSGDDLGGFDFDN